MGGTGGGDNGGNEETAQLKHRFEEARVAFWRVAREGCSRLIRQAPGAWQGRDARFYRREKQVITEHLEPFKYGALATIFLFATFRFSGSKWYRNLYNKIATSAEVKGEPNLRSEFVQQEKPAKYTSHLEKESEKKRKLMKDAMSLPMDFLLSVICGCSSAVLLFQPSKLEKDFVEAPLQPGKSLVDACFCEEMETAFNETMNQDMLGNIDDDDGTLQTFHSFVQNCRIRSQYVRSRTEKGDSRPDVIPFPGLDGVRR